MAAVTPRLAAAIAVVGLGAGNLAAHADGGGDTSPTEALTTVTVVATGVSNMNAASAGDVSQLDLASQPLLRPGAVLENVPGLIVTQHSGEGKANQYFLRAFNLDHGTDLSTELDDMPLNMPSHAHGQGYTDLNFMIPELIGDLHYKKGPYYADEGDFATAGAVRMDLIDEAPPSISVGVGQDHFHRELLMGSTDVTGGSLLGAVEVYHNDGPSTNPDDYDKLNGVLRYRHGSANDYFTVTAMAYDGTWTSTDQVPERAIAEGLINRFGTLAPTDGGISSRYSLSFDRIVRSDADQLQYSAYVIRYKLNLWSTFTYDLSDPVYGDQMLQHDNRVVYGGKISKSWFTELDGMPMTHVLGAQTRIDDIKDVGIDHTYQRQILYPYQDAGVVESNAAIYYENTLQWQPWLRTVLGLREDEFDFDVSDKMRAADGTCNTTTDPLGCDTGDVRANIFSPKLGFTFGPWRTDAQYLNNVDYFLTVADGYHSNDARGVTRSGQNPDAEPVTPLTRASSAEVGVAANPVSGWKTSLDVFYLHLKSELVFSGDAGDTEPSGATTREGVEWGNTWHINSWLHADFNAAFSRARFDQNVAPDDLGCGNAAPAYPCAQTIAITGRYIPNSPTNVIDASLTANHPSGLFGSLRARHFGASPLVEDDSAESPQYTTFDLQVGYQSVRKWTFAVDVFNLLDKKWNDIEYYYAARLPGEANAVPDYIVHPGVPLTVRAHLQYFF